jgi:hypothetical protein
MSYSLLRAARHSAAFWLVAGFLYNGELHGQTPAARGSTGNQLTSAASAGGNVSVVRGSGGSSIGSSATGSSNVRSGNNGSSFAGGFARGVRSQWQNGGGNAAADYGASSYSGGLGAYGAAGPYGTATYNSGYETVFPGGVAPLPRWREVGTTPLPTTYKANMDGANIIQPAVTGPPPSTPLVPVSPVTIPFNSTPSAGGGTTAPITLGFELPRAAPDQFGQAIAKRLIKLPSLHFQGNVRVDIVGRTAYLRGRVSSEHERELAEHVVLLEAGIDDVVNLMEVGGTSLQTPPPPTPAARAANG